MCFGEIMELGGNVLIIVGVVLIVMENYIFE